MLIQPTHTFLVTLSNNLQIYADAEDTAEARYKVTQTIQDAGVYVTIVERVK